MNPPVAEVRKPATRTGVLIVGAGPTGLALACDLRSRGIDVAVVDKAPGPATTSRALAVQPRGVEILERLGALGDLPDRAISASGLNVFAGQRRLMHLPLPTTAGAARPGVLLIGQAEVEGQLRTRLADFDRQVMWGTELIDAQEQETGLVIRLRTAGEEHVVLADWLVGCDGAHSKTRKLAGIAFAGATFAEKFLLADVRLDWARSRCQTAVWLHADGIFAALPLPGPDVWRLMVELPTDAGGPADHAGGSMDETVAVDLLQRLLRERVGDDTTRISDPAWISVFRFHRRLASTYRRGRILLAGDAAHIHSPFGGQGMNTGLGDAYNLGWKLAMVMQGRAREHLLDSYEAERRPVAAEVLKNTTTNTSLLLGKSVPARLVRDWLFLPTLNLPAVQRRQITRGSQLGVTYRGGPLAPSHGLFSRLAGLLRPGPRPGDRGPNAPCVAQPAGVPITLAEQTSAGWALLVFGEPHEGLSACIAAARSRLGRDLRVVRILRSGQTMAADGTGLVDAVLEDHEGEVARLYHPATSELVLLRPDGHLGWRASHAAASDLRHWLDEIMAREEAPIPSGLRPAVCASA